MFSFDQIPRDVAFEIIEHCENVKGTLLSLNLTSKSMHELCIPMLYRVVDLSSYNRGRITHEEDIVRPEI